MYMYQMMTPGPTMVAPEVMQARSKEFANPDVDTDFCEEYHELCGELADLMHTGNEVYLLGGEGILALEAACASLTEPGDRVLVIDNGIFGKGFEDFVRIYGGEPVLYSSDYHRAVDVEKLREFLKNDHEFKYATVVHCDTPSGVLNPIGEICPLLKEYGILTVVDCVASLFGDEVRVDDWKMDVVCGGSQKALSAPPGLAFVSVSQEARDAMLGRKVPIASFYANLTTFFNYYKDQWFPYTMPISDIYGFREAVRLVREDTGRIKRHEKIAGAVRTAVRAAGLSVYVTEDGDNASTVTAVCVPEGVCAQTIIERMRTEYGILISGSIAELSGKVIRLGHMGNNAQEEKVEPMLSALTKVFEELGVVCRIPLEQTFSVEMKNQS